MAIEKWTLSKGKKKNRGGKAKGEEGRKERDGGRGEEGRSVVYLLSGEKSQGKIKTKISTLTNKHGCMVHALVLSVS